MSRIIQEYLRVFISFYYADKKNNDRQCCEQRSGIQKNDSMS